MAKTLNLTLKVWRQENREAKGRIETYAAKDIPVDASFLEMLDIVNEGLVKEGKDRSCRAGIPWKSGRTWNWAARTSFSTSW